MAFSAKLGFHKVRMVLQTSLLLSLKPGIQSQCWYSIPNRVL